MDYRRLNNFTVKDSYPFLRIDDALNRLHIANWFSSLDLISGYWQVEFDHSTADKIAFATVGGLYQFTVMPFGLCNSTQFSRDRWIVSSLVFSG